MKNTIHWSTIIVGCLIMIGIWQYNKGNLTYVQASIAHGLLDKAWVRSQMSGKVAQPWPGSNTWPLARISVPERAIDQVILKNKNISIPSFALTHVEYSVFPGEMGNSVLSAPKHTYNAFLKHLEIGDILVLDSLHSGRWRFRVSHVKITTKSDTALLGVSAEPRLTLISCYPCVKPQDELRYVIIAETMERVENENTETQHIS